MEREWNAGTASPSDGPPRIALTLHPGYRLRRGRDDPAGSPPDRYFAAAFGSLIRSRNGLAR